MKINNKKKKNYIIISSHQNINILYLAKKLKQNILIITYDIKIKNFLIKILKNKISSNIYKNKTSNNYFKLL